MTDRERLDSEIDVDVWPLLRLHADLCDDEGDRVTAAGYRWLALWEKRPAQEMQPGGRVYRWRLGDCQLTAAERPRRGLSLIHWRAGSFNSLPAIPDRYLPPNMRYRPSGMWQFRQRSRAFREAAKAVGRWLLEGMMV